MMLLLLQYYDDDDVVDKMVDDDDDEKYSDYWIDFILFHFLHFRLHYNQHFFHLLSWTVRWILKVLAAWRTEQHTVATDGILYYE